MLKRETGGIAEMSLVYCPECGHEISNAAVACPNCGRPIHATPVFDRKVVVAQPPRRDGIPTWAIATVGVLGILLLFLLIAFWSRSGPDEGNQRVRVNMNTAAPSSTSRQTVQNEQPNVTTVPGSQMPVNPLSETTVGGSQTSVPAPPSKGTAIIQAKVITQNNQQQPVKNQRFYLLDKDVETILMDARIDPIEGQTLTDSLGLALIYPAQYSDFNNRALRAIKSHIKYAGTTDGSGKAKLTGIQPDGYFLLGVVKAGNGFAVWSSPVSIQPGENVLNLTPLQITEINQPSG